MVVVERMLLKRGKIKNNMSKLESAARIVVERLLLKRGPFKGGSTIRGLHLLAILPYVYNNYCIP